MGRPQSWQTVARWAAGGLLVAAGAGYVGWMLYGLALMRLQLVPSWDVAQTFWWPAACVTFPFAGAAIVAGAVLLRGWGGRPDAEPGAAADPAPKAGPGG